MQSDELLMRQKDSRKSKSFHVSHFARCKIYTRSYGHRKAFDRDKNDRIPVLFGCGLLIVRTAGKTFAFITFDAATFLKERMILILSSRQQLVKQHILRTFLSKLIRLFKFYMQTDFKLFL